MSQRPRLWIYVLNALGLWASDATVTYSSSAPSVATVQGSLVQARIAGVGVGRSTITATAEGISDSLLVIITSPSPVQGQRG
jgi:hypothetical protein